MNYARAVEQICAVKCRMKRKLIIAIIVVKNWIGVKTMRLIDADELLESISKRIKSKRSTMEIVRDIIPMIDAQPTAYDVDEVLHQIRVFYPQNDLIPDTPQALGYLICCSEQYRRLYGIIKRGGINENFDK